MSPPPPPVAPPSPLSASAVTSFIFGFLTYICLGPIAAIFAVIFGHTALRAIARSGGAIGGRPMALTGLIMGYVGFFPTLALWLALLIPVLRAPGERDKKADATIYCEAILLAINNYQLEYGHLPKVSDAPGDSTFADDNHKLLNILRAIPAGPNQDHAQNPRQIPFFDERQLEGHKPLSTFGPDGALRDPWGRPYHIRLDTDHDGRVENPYGDWSDTDWVKEEAIVWSYGRDGKPGLNGNGQPKHDIVSWKP